MVGFGLVIPKSNRFLKKLVSRVKTHLFCIAWNPYVAMTNPHVMFMSIIEQPSSFDVNQDFTYLHDLTAWFRKNCFVDISDIRRNSSLFFKVAIFSFSPLLMMLPRWMPNAYNILHHLFYLVCRKKLLCLFVSLASRVLNLLHYEDWLRMRSVCNHPLLSSSTAFCVYIS